MISAWRTLAAGLCLSGCVSAPPDFSAPYQLAPMPYPYGWQPGFSPPQRPPSLYPHTDCFIFNGSNTCTSSSVPSASPPAILPAQQNLKSWLDGQMETFRRSCAIPENTTPSYAKAKECLPIYWGVCGHSGVGMTPDVFRRAHEFCNENGITMLQLTTILKGPTGSQTSPPMLQFP